MRKSLFISLFLILLITDSYAQDKKVAVVTFYAVKQIGLTDFSSAAAAAAIARLGNDPGFNMAPMLKNFHDQLFENYFNNFHFKLLPEDEVTNNGDYKVFISEGTAGGSILNDNINLAVEGYKVILPLKGNANEKSLLKIFSQCDGILKVFISFDLEVKGFGGLGLAKINAHANVILFNKNGDKVFSVKEEALSKISGALIAGMPVLTADKVLPLCESALNELTVVMQKNMPKMVKKADGKL